MANGIIHSVSGMVAACGRHVSRASRRLRSGSTRLRSLEGAARIAPSWVPYLSRRLSRRLSRIPFRSRCSRRTTKKEKPRESGHNKYWRMGLLKCTAPYGEKGEEEEREGDGDTDVWESSDEEEEDMEVWRRTILLGEKCQPLSFSGAIYYDSEGRQVPEPPLRSPLRSPLPGYSYSSLPVIVVVTSDSGHGGHN